MPAICTVAISMRVMAPKNNPTAISAIITPKSPATVSGIGGRLFTTGTSVRLNISASSRRTRGATYASPKPGSSMNADPSRQKMSRKAKTCEVRN